MWYDDWSSATTTTTSIINIPLYTTGGTTNSIYSNNVWQEWSATSATSTQAVWANWVRVRQMQDYQSVVPQPEAPRVRTAQEIAAEETRMREYREAESRRRRLIEEAEARAEALLLHHLTPEQVDDYKRKKHFTVCAKSGSRYRVNCASGYRGNIILLGSKDEYLGGFCAHAPSESMVGADHYLAQMLNLRHNEEEFLRVANRH